MQIDGTDARQRMADEGALVVLVEGGVIHIYYIGTSVGGRHERERALEVGQRLERLVLALAGQRHLGTFKDVVVNGEVSLRLVEHVL